jgi:predicted nucleic acid-binding protein/GNAT superfamily N-acetyltransferase
MEFRFIDHTDPLLEQVIDLGKRNSKTLGLMPRDAYIEQARKRCIVVAYEGKKLIGYCLFRITTTKHRIGITQVCVDSGRRQAGVAKALLSQITNKYHSLLNGMLVSCREDYVAACKLWQKFGFVIKKRTPSRSIRKERNLLKLWYAFGHKDLFSQEENSELVRVALDLNILINLQELKKCSDEIKQLSADWLADEVEYVYTPETLNEIHRDKDFGRTNEMIKFLGNFIPMSCSPTESEPFMESLALLHPGDSVNHQSDRKQLAECKACSLNYFLTIDEELLENRNDIYDQLGINILRPSEFILEIDELKNRNLYEPLRLQGARFEVKRLSSTELLEAADVFLHKDKGERKSDFKRKIETLAANARLGQIKIITSPKGDPIACYGTMEQSNELIIPFLRVKPGALFNTLSYQLLAESIRETANMSRCLIRLEESYITEDQEKILMSNGFEKKDNNWLKLSISEIDSFASVVGRHKLSEAGSIFANDIGIIISHSDPDIKIQLTVNLEKKLWPIKFEDLDVPVYVVPIKPFWASQLFDSLSSNTLLFGALPELSWSKENVYYRSVRPNVEKAPGRILWYASDQNGFMRKKAIIACSYLNGVTIGPAKSVFSSFRRFGIYSWKEILKLTNGKVKQEIKALQFSDTELFKKPISFTKTNEILESHGLKKQTFVSPVKVNNAVFNTIYRLTR